MSFQVMSQIKSQNQKILEIPGNFTKIKIKIVI